LKQKVKDRLVPTVNALAQDLQVSAAKGAPRTSFQAIAKQVSETTAVGQGEEKAVDLGLLATSIEKAPAMSATTKQLARQVNVELQRATVAHLTTNLEAGTLTGLKIYLDPTGFDADYQNASLQSFGTSAWAKFLNVFFRR
jgi:ethanolamine ammonia-lyase large subunit